MRTGRISYPGSDYNIGEVVEWSDGSVTVHSRSTDDEDKVRAVTYEDIHDFNAMYRNRRDRIVEWDDIEHSPLSSIPKYVGVMDDLGSRRMTAGSQGTFVHIEDLKEYTRLLREHQSADIAYQVITRATKEMKREGLPLGGAGNNLGFSKGVAWGSMKTVEILHNILVQVLSSYRPHGKEFAERLRARFAKEMNG